MVGRHCGGWRSSGGGDPGDKEGWAARRVKGSGGGERGWGWVAGREAGAPARCGEDGPLAGQRGGES